MRFPLQKGSLLALCIVIAGILVFALAMIGALP